MATVEGPLYRAVVSSEGGKLQEMTLHYRGEKPVVLVGETGPTGLMVGPREGAGEVVPMEIDPRAVSLGPEQRSGANLNYLARARGARATLLPSSWVLLRCPSPVEGGGA